MIVIEKIEQQGVCCFCNEVASVKINGLPFCASCGDGELVKIIKKCSKALQQATATFKIIPNEHPNEQKSI